MDKKTLTIVGVILAVIVILVCVIMGMQATNTSLSSDEIMRINEEKYTKEEYMSFIKYRLYKNNGDYGIDEEKHASDIENGVSKENIFLSDSLNEFYKFKAYKLLAEQKGIEVSGDELTTIEEDYTTNEAKITEMGISKEDYIEFEKIQAIINKISASPSEYLEFPEDAYNNYLNQFSGDMLKSYTFRMMQVGYTEDSENESGEMVSGDKAYKEAYMTEIVNRIKSGESFEEASESGDFRIIYVGNGIQYAKSMLEHSSGIILEQKLGSKELYEAVKNAQSGDLTEIVDSGSAFQVAEVENIEDGIVGESKQELLELLVANSTDDLVYSVIKDMEVNQSAVSRIKIK